MSEGPLGPRILGNKIGSYDIILDHEQGLDEGSDFIGLHRQKP